MPSFRIEKLGRTVEAKDAKDALRIVAAENGWDCAPLGKRDRASIGVVGVGLVVAERVVTAAEAELGARRRAAGARRAGDVASAESWEREAEKRSKR